MDPMSKFRLKAVYQLYKISWQTNSKPEFHHYTDQGAYLEYSFESFKHICAIEPLPKIKKSS